MNRGPLNSTANSSGPSVGESSLVTDANSTLSGGPQLQRSASINTESYLRLPASPMSFSSNNISGSSVMDGSTIAHQSSLQGQIQKQGMSTATSQPTPLESDNMFQVQKKPRLDVKQDDILQQQVIQQLLQRQDSLQPQGQMNPQLQSLIQQQRLLQQRQQQQQILQSLPPMQRAHMQQQQQQQQLRHHLQQQMVPAPHLKCPFDSGICARRLMQYIYHQRYRPRDNCIVYWRKFVTEYFAPRARKRWCLSLYENVGNHTLGVFPQAAMDTWKCDICGSKSGKGFEAAYEVLPRLNKIKFDNGVIDELLFLDMPHECRLPSGIMLLEYAKATQETVYENLRVVREGQLRIIFTPDLKIYTWEFCARRHEELVPRRLVAPQVNQLLQVAQKYQNAVTESGSARFSAQDLQTNCNMFLSAGCQLAKSLELPSLNELGFPKRYVRCLQISEVVNSMEDLTDFNWSHDKGPIESLKMYPHQAAMKLQNQKMQEGEQPVNAQSLPTDQNAPSKIMTMHPGLGGHLNNNNHIVLNNSTHSAVALNNYQSLLRQNSTNSNSSALQSDVPCVFGGANQAQSAVLFQGPGPLLPGSLTTNPDNCLPGSHEQTQQQPPSGNLLQQNNPQPSQVNHHSQDHAIQQLLQEMMDNNRGTSLIGPNVNGHVAEEIYGGGVSGPGGLPVRATAGSVGNRGFGNITAAQNNAAGMIPSRSNSFKSISGSSPAIGSSSLNIRSDVPQSLHLPDLVQDISQDFADAGMLNGESSADMGYGWKS